MRIRACWGRYCLRSNSTKCYSLVVERSEVLKTVMTQTATTQAQLSALSGVKQPSISQMLHDRIPMSDDMLERLLSCMGFELEVVRRPVRAKLERSVERRWRMHRSLSAMLSLDSLRQWKPKLRRNLETLRRESRGEPHLGNIARWRELISTDDLTGLRRAMTGLDPLSVQMREVSPFGGLLPEEERQRVLLELRR